MKRLLQVCFIAAMVFGLASCNKEENGGGAGASTNGSLVGTQWVASDGDAQITLTFASATEAEVAVIPPHGVEERYRGTYTYNNGNGTMSLPANGTTYDITFTVSGNTLTAHNTPAGEVVFTRVNNGGQQPNPGPTPGGNYPLNNTAWQSSFTDGDVDVTMTVTFGTTNCSLETYVDGYLEDQTQGYYTYSGTITSGQGTITVYGEVGTFVVTGNEASVTAEGETHVFVRIRK